MKTRRQGKSMFNTMLKRSHEMRWLKGYICALNDILKKRDVAYGLGLKGDEVIHFISAETKAMISASINKHDVIEEQFRTNKPIEIGKIEFDTAPKL